MSFGWTSAPGRRSRCRRLIRYLALHSRITVNPRLFYIWSATSTAITDVMWRLSKCSEGASISALQPVKFTCNRNISDMPRLSSFYIVRLKTAMSDLLGESVQMARTFRPCSRYFAPPKRF